MEHTQLGKYEILEEVGRGGFATVYRALDTTLEREVALKVLDPLLMRDEAFVNRFHREARAAASLEHPNIVPIYEVGESGGRLFIAMRLVRGPSLAEQLEEEGHIPWEETLGILRPVCDALAYAHDKSVVHRDIKPHNILLDERSVAMLTDFGFARLVGTSSLTQSLSGGIVGTPAYIAPEIWEGVDATPATDVYALACVTYEMLAGDALFGGKTPMAVMRAHDRGAQLPEEWPIDIPQDIGGIMARSLARRPDERYQDVPQFLGALEDLQTAAVADRIAAEVDRLLGEMHEDLEANEFERAVAAGNRLLEIKSDHAEGARLLGEAQAKLVRMNELAEQLEQERDSWEQDQETLSVKKASLVEKQSDLKAKSERLAAERDEIEEKLKRIEGEQGLCEEKAVELNNQLEELEKERTMHDRRSKRLSKGKTLLAKGHLDQLETLLNQPIKPRQDSQQTKVKPPAQIPKKEEKVTTRVSCPECQGENPPREQFCIHCGSRISGGSAQIVARGKESGEGSMSCSKIVDTKASDQGWIPRASWAGLAGFMLFLATIAFVSDSINLFALLIIAAVVFGVIAIWFSPLR